MLADKLTSEQYAEQCEDAKEVNQTGWYNMRLFQYENGLCELRTYSDVVGRKPCNMPQELLMAISQVARVRNQLKKHTVYNPLYEEEIGLYDFDEMELDAKRKAHSAYNSYSRTLQNIYAVSRQCNWKWFITLTFSDEKADRYSYSDTMKKARKWFDNQRQRKAPDMQYLIVGEGHKDGAWHVHGLMAQCEGVEFVPRQGKHKSGRVDYNIGKWNYGFSYACEVGDGYDFVVCNNTFNGSVYIYVMVYPTEYDLCMSVEGSKYFFMFAKDGKMVASEEDAVDFHAYKFRYKSTLSTPFSYQSHFGVQGVGGNNIYGNCQYASITADSSLSDYEIIYSDEDVYKYEIVDGVAMPLYNDEMFYYATDYDFNEWCVDAGLSCSASANESDTVIPFWYNENYIYFVRKWWNGTESTEWQLTMILDDSAGNIYPYYVQCENGGTIGVGSYLVETTPVTVRNFTYDPSGNGWLLKDFNTYDVGSTNTYDNINVLVGGTYEVVYSNCNIYGFSDGAGIWQEKSSGYYEPIQPDITPDVTPEPTTTPESGSGGDSSDTGGTGSDGGGTGGGTRPETNVDLGVDLGNITLDEIPEVIKNIKDSIKEFFGLVGVVPLMIGSIFGFLPDWCLWVLGVSFAFVGILLVFKLIRG